MQEVRDPGTFDADRLHRDEPVFLDEVTGFNEDEARFFEDEPLFPMREVLSFENDDGFHLYATVVQRNATVFPRSSRLYRRGEPR